MNVRLAVNGTLMRGLALNGNLLAVGATFVREARTAPAYRLWSIGDRHPAMLRVTSGGASIAVEVWSVPAAGLATILMQEPPGLSIGKVRLDDAEEVLGVLGEPADLPHRRGRDTPSDASPIRMAPAKPALERWVCVRARRRLS